MVAITPTPKIKNLYKLLMHCQRRRYAAKSNIICAGDRSDTLFFIIKGSVTILIEDDDVEAEDLMTFGRLMSLAKRLSLN